MEKNCLLCNKVFSKSSSWSKSYWINQRQFCGNICANKYKVGKKLDYGDKISVALKKAYRENRRTGFIKGQASVRKGVKTPGWTNQTSFKKGHKTHENATKNLTNRFPKGNTPWNKNKRFEKMSGKKHWNWKGGVDKGVWFTREYQQWRKAVFERDDYTCQICNLRGVELQADHIKPRYLYPELTYDLSNGRTLCKPCHIKTPTYGRKVYNLTAL